MTTIPPQDGVTFLHELSPGARALAARCVPRVNEFARRMARAPLDEVPGHGELPVDVHNVEIAAAVRHELRLFVKRGNGSHALLGGYGAFRERAARRAEENVPLPLLLRAHALGGYVLWKALRETARPGEEAALVELSGLLLRAQEGIAGAVAETYLAEQAALVAEQGEQRRSLVRGLLDGTLPADAAGLDALGLDRGGLVLHLRIDRGGPQASSGGADHVRWGTGRPRPGRPSSPALSPIAVRRRRRRVQTVLDRAFGTEVLTLIEDDGGHAVVPARSAPDGRPRTPDGLAERLRRACGGQVRIAAIPADRPAGIADAARTASEVVRIAHASGRPPGMHRLDDVLLEFHLSRQNESSGLIAALLDPVGERPELVETLRTYLEHQQDRRITARRLGLHPNTVDNRLARIADLTGLDLTSPRGTALALAALLLRESPPRGVQLTGLP